MCESGGDVGGMQVHVFLCSVVWNSSHWMFSVALYKMILCVFWHFLIIIIYTEKLEISQLFQLY